MRKGNIRSMKIKLDEGANVPVRGHVWDAGLDLRTPERVVVPKCGSAVIDTGVRCVIPRGFFGKLESKSGLHVKHDIVCLGGTIDADYRGSIVVKLYNLGNEDYTFEPGDKVVQLIIIPCECEEVELVDDIDMNTERSVNGFGSTGR